MEAGEVVERLVDDDARVALARAEAEVTQAEAELEAARLALGASTSTDEVEAAGSALAELEAELASVPAQVAGHEAKVAELEAELASRQRAVERELVAPLQVELLEARLRAAAAGLEGARQQEQVLQARLDRRRNELQSELAIARARLRVAEAVREQATLAMTRSNVTSPVSGVVLSRQIEPGSNVRGGEADLGRNTLQFKVSIDEPSPQLKPQMTARVRFLAPVQDDDEAEQRAALRQITLGEVRQDEWIEVRSGLNPGDRLIVDPPADLRQSQRLYLREASFNDGATAGANR